MKAIPVENLVFTFDSSTVAQKYDDWRHPMTGKAVDIVAVHPSTTTWLIEAKDFRVISKPPKPSNNRQLPETMAQKVTDTLVGLADAAFHASDPSEKLHAILATSTPHKRVVLHLEPYTGRVHSYLFPVNFSANVHQKLRQLISHIDPNPLVLNIANTPRAGVPWSVK